MSRVVGSTWILVMVIAAAAACDKGGGGGGGGAPSPEPVGDPVDRTIMKMSKIADELCACHDAACSEAVLKQMSALANPAGTPNKAQMERAMAIAEKMAECQKRLMAAPAAGAGTPADSDRTRVLVKKLAYEAYPQWAITPSNADKCPTVADLAAFIDQPADGRDPWGNPYTIRCGADLPAGVRGIAVASPGPDGQPGTADDLTSWEP